MKTNTKTWAKVMNGGKQVQIIAKSADRGIERANAMMRWLRAGGLSVAKGSTCWRGEYANCQELVITIVVGGAA